MPLHMSHFKTFISHHFHTLLKPQNPLHRSHITNSCFSRKSLPLSSLFYGTQTSSIQIEDSIEPENGNGKKANKKPLDVMFKEALSVSLCENAESSESEGENSALKSRLRELEREVRRLNANSRVGNKGLKKSKGKGLYAVFTNQEGCKEGCEERGEEPEESVEEKGLKKSKGKGLYAAFTNQEGCEEGCEESGEEPEESVENKGLKKSKGKSLHATFTNQEASKDGCEERRGEEPEVFKELSPDMEVFASHLYREGYFNNANFLRANKLEFGYFESHYGLGYMRFAAEKFGKDHQEIAKWLSGSDLKKIALFGCPSLEKKNVFAAKRLRKFFEIQENTVCSKCVLKQSCKFVNQSVWTGDTKNLNLAVVMRVIILYALERVPAGLAVPTDIKDSVSKLLKEVLKLSRSTP